MDQVKRDMEADEKLKKDWEKVQTSSDKIRQKSVQGEEKLQAFGENLKSLSSKTSELLSSWKEKASSATSRVDEITEQNEALKKAREYVKSASESTAAGSKVVIDKTKDVFGGVMDMSSRAFSFLGDESSKAEKTKQWKAARDAMAATEKESETKKADAETEATEEGSAKAQASSAAKEAESALVVSKASSSSWDRFGAGLRDMPFLSSVFENPVFDRLFGESEIAASIREMKEQDYSFRLEEFAEDIEYVVAPHIIKNYLEGNAEALEKHCGEAAFAAVNASIKERRRQKLTLDTAILAGPRELELKGAKLMEQGAPCFIWTFSMQQVNCLRDANGEVVEGAVDDIRSVMYAMAVTRNPNLDKLDLEYPWQVAELAILFNQPSI
jgi:mitochondrial import inner membrane translocase subunit TIM44